MDNFGSDFLILFPAEQPNSMALLVHRPEENLLAAKFADSEVQHLQQDSNHPLGPLLDFSKQFQSPREQGIRNIQAPKVFPGLVGKNGEQALNCEDLLDLPWWIFFYPKSEGGF